MVGSIYFIDMPCEGIVITSQDIENGSLKKDLCKIINL